LIRSDVLFDERSDFLNLPFLCCAKFLFLDGSIGLLAGGGFNVLFVFIPGGFFCFALIISIYSAKGWKKLADIHGIDSLKAGLGYCHDQFHAAILLKQGCTLTPEKKACLQQLSVFSKFNVIVFWPC